jgi:hypothetical protein
MYVHKFHARENLFELVTMHTVHTQGDLMVHLFPSASPFCQGANNEMSGTKSICISVNLMHPLQIHVDKCKVISLLLI